MTQVFKEYLAHKDNLLYLALLMILGFVLWQNGAFVRSWYFAFLLLIAPWFEWLVHKYLLHNRPLSKHPAIQDYYDKIHFYHHRDPKIIRFVFAPFPIPLFIPLFFVLLIALVFWSVEAGLVAGFFTLAYYLYYEWIHLAHHIDSYTPWTRRGRELKKAHQWHHYKNENFWWGVTSSFGDKTLGTYMNPQEVERSPTVRDFSQKS